MALLVLIKLLRGSRAPDLKVLLGTGAIASLLAAMAILLPASSGDEPAMVEQAPAARTVAITGECSDAYAPCVLEAADRNCADIGFRVTRTGYADPYGLDRDGDGVGCESYPEKPEGERTSDTSGL